MVQQKMLQEPLVTQSWRHNQWTLESRNRMGRNTIGFNNSRLGKTVGNLNPLQLCNQLHYQEMNNYIHHKHVPSLLQDMNSLLVIEGILSSLICNQCARTKTYTKHEGSESIIA